MFTVSTYTAELTVATLCSYPDLPQRSGEGQLRAAEQGLQGHQLWTKMCGEGDHSHRQGAHW